MALPRIFTIIPSRSQLAPLLGLVTALFVLSSTGASTPQKAGSWEPEKTHALIVSMLEWKHGLSSFSKRHRKDQELRDLLIKRGTPAENVTLLLGKDATLQNIRKAITHTLAKTSQESTLIYLLPGPWLGSGRRLLLRQL